MSAIDVDKMGSGYSAMWNAACDINLTFDEMVFAATTLVAAVIKESCGGDKEKQERAIRVVEQHIRDTLARNTITQ